MIRRRLERFAVALLLVCSSVLTAQPDQPDTQFGNFLFSVPAGWNPQEKNDAMVIYAPGLRPGSTGFIALSADNLQGDLRNSFNILWRGFARSYRVLRGGQAVPVQTNKGYDAFYTEAIAADRQGTRWHVFVLAAQYKQRIQVVMFMDNFDETGHQASFNVFKNWLTKLSFGDSLAGSNIPSADASLKSSHKSGETTTGTDGASTAKTASEASVDVDKPHKVPAGMLDGFYVGGAVSGRYGTGIGRNHLFFSPDGWVVKINLNDSMVGFDVTAYRNRPDTNRSWVGRYRVSGNDINILWQDYTEHREVIQRNEDAANPAINVYIPECRCTGKKFAGKYNWGLAGSGQSIQFFADGSFLDRGVTDQIIVPSPFFDRPRTQRGTYNIQDQTIIFNFADGHRGMKTFLAPKAQQDRQTFDWINLGVNTMYEEHYQAEP